jgi:hypothetical protein
MLYVFGLTLDMIGAWLLLWAECYTDAAFVKPRASSEGRAWFKAEVNKLVWYKRWPLSISGILISRGSTRKGQAHTFDSFPLKAWGILFLTCGFFIQALARLLGQK